MLGGSLKSVRGLRGGWPACAVLRSGTSDDSFTSSGSVHCCVPSHGGVESAGCRSSNARIGMSASGSGVLGGGARNRCKRIDDRRRGILWLSGLLSRFVHNRLARPRLAATPAASFGLLLLLHRAPQGPLLGLFFRAQSSPLTPARKRCRDSPQQLPPVPPAIPSDAPLQTWRPDTARRSSSTGSRSPRPSVFRLAIRKSASTTSDQAARGNRSAERTPSGNHSKRGARGHHPQTLRRPPEPRACESPTTRSISGPAGTSSTGTV